MFTVHRYDNLKKVLWFSSFATSTDAYPGGLYSAAETDVEGSNYFIERSASIAVMLRIVSSPSSKFLFNMQSRERSHL